MRAGSRCVRWQAGVPAAVASEVDAAAELEEHRRVERACEPGADRRSEVVAAGQRGAAAQIQRAFPDARFMIVGAPAWRGDRHHLQELQERIQSDGLNEAITLAGTRNDIPSVMNAMDIVAVPSAREIPFPNSGLIPSTPCRPLA